MPYLLDTQILLWALEDNPRVSGNVRAILADGENRIFVSIASLWEIAIKVSIKKLVLTQPLAEIIKMLPQIDISILGLAPEHLLEVQTLDLVHRDPFDRIIIAQAIVEDFEVLSSDEIFNKYPVMVLW